MAKRTKEEFIERAKKIHGDKYDYSKVEYINSKTKVCIICPKHGEFWQEPTSHLMGVGCPKCAIRSRAEKIANTKEQFIEVAMKLKEIPDVSLSTDIIVGFPGETEEQFLDTLDVVKKVKFDQIFMFIYSPREGTVGAKMEDHTPYEEKVNRLERLKKLYEDTLPELNKKMVGKTYKLLVEGNSKTNDKLYTGRTSQNKVVIFEAADDDIGEVVNVKIDSDHLWYLKGTIVR